eukprot:Tbor_TRINITY_DN6154_c0_g3::TRINITY_DN6154_c0_g3_i1::g.22142::m.22142
MSKQGFSDSPQESNDLSPLVQSIQERWFIAGNNRGSDRSSSSTHTTGQSVFLNVACERNTMNQHSFLENKPKETPFMSYKSRGIGDSHRSTALSTISSPNTITIRQQHPFDRKEYHRSYSCQTNNRAYRTNFNYAESQSCERKGNYISNFENLRCINGKATPTQHN